MALYDDLAWFEANRQWIAATYPGKFVLIKNKAVVGAYPSQPAAYQAGIAMFGPEQFAVKQATVFEETQFAAIGSRRRRMAQAAAQPAQQQQQVDPVERLRHDGAVVTVAVGPPNSQAQAAAGQGKPVGNVQTVKGMVDTGASISTVSDQVAQAAGLIQTGSVPLGGVGGTSERPIYAAAITLPEWGVTVDPIELGGVTIPMPGIDMLIGRDVLRSLSLAYQGSAGAFQLTSGAAAQPGQVAGAPGSPAAPGASQEVIPGVPGGWVPIAAGAAVLGIAGLVLFKVI